MDRRRALKKRLASGVVLFMGNDHTPMNFPANTYRFCQDASFLYYWGLDQPGLCAVIDIDNDRDIIFGDDPTVEETTWTGPVTSLHRQAMGCAVDVVKSTKDLALFIDKAVQSRQRLHYLQF